MSECEPDDSCTGACREEKNICLESCQISDAQTVDTDDERFIVDTSIDVFAAGDNADALAEAEAELKEAVDILHKILQANDERWAEKQKFAATLAGEMEAVFKELPGEQAKKAKTVSEIIRAGLEKVRDTGLTAQDAKDLKGYFKTGVFEKI